MSAPGDVPPEILSRLRPICRALPEAYEEPAWIGLRWRIRQRTVAHVYTADPERQLAYPRDWVTDEPPVLMTFRVPPDDLLGLTGSGFPFFRAGWGHNVAGMFLNSDTDWTEVAEVLTDSYCEMAPKFLAARAGLVR
ncbi:MmcQ/YjbR family DNA-binding protein [Paractinoplanes lichenicola]|uniref:MmcQ/YjbR family DNA-binding protein n=1 Tax=Paractinoplanes lichenicola TaxID=2802976 RepID=A0ABS1VHA6_9ACTN|nr:MmcQ/YjbR family DNA-binding protein [Actinoplanes lichenicola]MBL7254030.1 MmcQ/YjbR family DNA-binding protein [Actinoplanes lichenicola]